MKKLVPVLLALMTLACETKTPKEKATLSYPETNQVDTIDTYFGTEVVLQVFASSYEVIKYILLLQFGAGLVPIFTILPTSTDVWLVPAHSFKFAAGLQAAHAGDNPVLIRIETDAGHGAGTPISKSIEQAADKYAFAWYNMGVIPEMARNDM